MVDDLTRPFRPTYVERIYVRQAYLSAICGCPGRYPGQGSAVISVGAVARPESSPSVAALPGIQDQESARVPVARARERARLDPAAALGLRHLQGRVLERQSLTRLSRGARIDWSVLMF